MQSTKKKIGEPDANGRTLQAARGGPYSGKMLLLGCAGTLTFKVAGWRGHYDRYMQWCAE